MNIITPSGKIKPALIPSAMLLLPVLCSGRLKPLGVGEAGGVNWARQTSGRVFDAGSVILSADSSNVWPPVVLNRAH